MSKSQDKTKSNPALRAILMLIAATTLIIIFVVMALLLAPQDYIPEFEITDQQGEWKAQGTIAVFDDLIKPGSEGKYDFIIRSECEEVLRYGFRLSEYLDNNNQDAYPFMLYRLKMDNVYIGDGEWHYVGLDYNEMEIRPGSEHNMTLEWKWPFDIGQNENDTLVGITGAKLSVSIFIWAEII